MKKIITSTTFLATLCCVLWASPFVLLKVGLEIMPRPIEFAGYRFLLAGVIIALFTGVGIKEYLREVRENLSTVIIVSIFHTSLLYSFFYMGQMRVDAAIGALIVGGQPLFVALFAHFMKKDDKMNIRKALSILLGLIGLVVVAMGKVDEISIVGWTSIIGILFLIGNNVSSGISNVIISRVHTHDIKPLVFSSSQLIVGGETLLCISYMWEGFYGLPMQWQWWASIAGLVFISAVAISLWFVLLARPGVKVSELNMWKFLIPVIGSIEAWVFMKNESPTPTSLAGLIILTSSLVMLNYPVIKKLFVNKNTKISSK